MPVPVRAQALHQRVAVGARDGRFAGRIDVGDDHHVGIVEAGAELLEQGGQPRIAMRLHHGDDLSFGRFTRGAQHGGDLDRMVAELRCTKSGPLEPPLAAGVASCSGILSATMRSLS